MCLGYKYNIIKLFLSILINIGMFCYYCEVQTVEDGGIFFEDVKCYEDLGCVRLTREWMHPKFRPINVLPANRHAVNTIFVHWTLCDGKLKPNVLGTNQLADSAIRAYLKILVHDFTSNGYTGWIKHLSRALLENPDTVGLKVVSVDWAAGAEPPYVQAVANARLVALEIIHFLNTLQAKFGLNPETVHIVGHGVGAHIAGYVGKMRRLRRITALDPSGPHFQSMPPNVRLHKNDAKFIDVVHSDAATYGQGNGEILGHVDYFPNGGKEQPGCMDLNLKVTSVKRGDLKLGQTLSACSHKRSIKYYIEALANPSCIFLGIACSSHKEFVQGKCASCGAGYEYCARLHPLSHPRKINNTGFYFVTSNSSPFCVEMLKVLLVLRSKLYDQSFVKGYFNVTIPQPSGDVTFLLNENHPFAALRADDHHVFVVFRSTPPVLNLPARAIHIKWLHAPLPCAWCTPPKITGFMIYKMTYKSSLLPQWFCPVSGAADEPIGMGLKPCQKDGSTTSWLPDLINTDDYYESF